MSNSEISFDFSASTLTAGWLGVSGLATGYIGSSYTDSDWFKIYLVSGTTYTLSMLGTQLDSYLVVRDASGASLGFVNQYGVGGVESTVYTPTSTGVYYLDAQSYWSSVYNTGAYALSVTSNIIDDYAAFTSTTSTLTLAQPRNGSIEVASDADWHKVTLTAGVSYQVSVTGGTLPNPYIALYNSNGNQIGAYADGLTYTPTISDTYYVEVYGYYLNNTGTYTVEARELPTVSIANANVVEGNSANTTTNLVFTLTLSSASPVPVSVTASTSGTSTASVGIDYNAASSIVTFAAGQTSATFTVQVRGDTIFEPSEILYVNLTNPQGAVLGNSNASGLIFDNDSSYTNLPSDLFLQLQWYLYDRTGVNVFSVWNDYTGAGVKVAVFDQGIDPNHTDLNGNLLASLGMSASNLSAGGAPILSSDNHGTAVAGTIAAERDGIGTVGVAYGANLVSIYGTMTVGEIANAFNYSANFDVLNNSWGFAPQGYSYQTLYGTWAFYDNFQAAAFSSAGTALANLAANGRSGLGTVVVQSAGNSFSLGDDTNLHNFQNSQYIITVAATDYFGDVTSYSSPGASVLVAAPGGGGTDLLSDIITTDRVGAAGNSTTDYTTIQGTSFSAPIVSGIVALMLNANPDLGYRDVQEILAYSARLTSSASNIWDYNGATNWNGGGLHYDSLEHNLGFGLVDAHAAVRLAETWGTSHTAANRQQVSITHSPSLTIPDNGISGAFDSISVSQPIEVERVEVTLNVTHPFIGDLSILLTSPSGTSSFLLWRPQQNPLSAYGTSQNDIHFTFDTVLDWGESSVGTWGLGVYDQAAGFIGSFDSWTLNLIGKPSSADDTYIYTNEFAEACIDQASRTTLMDSGGIDTLNAAACSSNLTLNLASGGSCTIDDRSLAIAAGTVIENAYCGDGNDTAIGNGAANSLYGGRGNDMLTGGAGNDAINGGTGNDTIDGGTGNDTIIYSGSRSSYVVTVTASGYLITSASDGADTLTNVEYAIFSDQTITLASIDTTAPTVSTFSPADAVTGIAIASNIVLTFSEAIQRGTGNIILKNAAGTTIETFNAATSSLLSISGTTLTINPTSDLAYSTNYVVTFASGNIKDLAGNAYAGTTTYDFTTTAAPDTTVPVAPKLFTNAAFNFQIDPQVTMQTNLGPVTFELNPEQAPITVANMLAYANAGFYDNTLFHRVIPNFMVQGGGFTTGLSYKTPTYNPIVLESDNGLSNLRGTIAMARTSVADSATTQFFVNHVDNTFLNYSSAASLGYTVFGKVVSGQSVIDSIAQVPTTTVGAYANVPVTDVTITSLQQTLVGSSITNAAILTVSDLEAGAQWSYSLDGGASWTAGTGNNFLVPVGSYAASTIEIMQTDAAGNASASGKFTSALVVETTAPTITTFSPADAATGISIASDIVITFSEAIQRGTGNIILKNAAGTTIETFNAATSSLLSISGTTLTINPASNLAYSANHFVTFASGTIKDLAGNAYTGTTAYDFTTMAAPDTTAPTVTTFNPSDAATGVAIAGNIVVTFSEAIQRGTGSIILKNAAGTTIETFDAATNSNLSISGTTLTINPTSNLAYSANHFVTFASGTIKDLAGNAYTGTTAYDFTTMAAPFTGTTGNDALTGGTGNDTLDGGTGIDTASYTGNRADFTVTASGTGFIVTDTTGANGTDTLVNIERLSFADGSLGLDISGTSGQMYRLYKAAFNRIPDAPGLGWNIDLVDGGLTLAQMSAAFVASAEFSSTYGSLTNAQFLDRLYLNVLGRPADAAGAAWNLNLLDTNAVDHAGMLAAYSESAENQAAVIGQIQDGIWFT